MGDVPDPSSGSTYDAYQFHLQKALLATTKLSHSLPAPSEIAFHRTLDNNFASSLDGTSHRLLELVNRTLGIIRTAQRQHKGKRKEAADEGEEIFSSEEEVVDGYGRASDLVDWLLERTDDTLDLLSGRKAISDAAVASILASSRPPAQAGRRSRRTGELLPKWILNDTSLAKPQREWKVDNGRELFWTPRKEVAKRKWHALEGNEEVVTSVVDLEGELDEDGQPKQGVPHPYTKEIEHLRSNASPSDPIYHPPPLPDPSTLLSPEDSFASRPFTFIDSPSLFTSLLAHLRTCGPSGAKTPDLALDLEHHDLRSYHGLTCLLQLSTRSHDFVIDVLSPSLRPLLPSLGEFFADPEIVKVLHGGESDVLWLQRDCGLYLVNAFDTYHACCVLGLAKRSLASLLETYAGFAADKRYQLADWRIRPLPEQMLLYARSDTHFLLDVYDRLRHLLLEKGKSPHSSAGNGTLAAVLGGGDVLTPLNEVLRRSADTSLRRWEPKTYDFDEGHGQEAWRGLAIKWGKAADWGIEAFDLMTGGRGKGGGRGVTFEVFRAVHDWRDRIAREEDESPRYVLSNQLLFKLADRVPTTSGAVMTCCSPVPPLVSARAADLASLISRTAEAARARGAPEAAAPTSIPVEKKPVVERKEVKVQPAKGLWGSSGSERLQAKDSSMFGAPAPPSSLITATSVLFGGAMAKLATEVIEARAARVRDVLAKIALAMPFSLTGAEGTEGSAAEDYESSTPEQERAVEMTDHVFIPKSQRETKPAVTEPEEIKEEEDDDSEVVIVGKMADVPKKRKRGNKTKNRTAALATPNTTPAGTDGEGASTSSAAGAAEGKRRKKNTDKSTAAPKKKRLAPEDVKPFDYSTEPSILDRKPPPPQQQGGSGQSPQKKKTDATAAGEFGKPPRKMNEPKAGNMTMRWSGS